MGGRWAVRWGQNASNGLRRGKTTSEEVAWRCFEQKGLGWAEVAVSWIDRGLKHFMVKAQGNTGLEKVLLSCMRSEGSLTGLPSFKEYEYLWNGSLETGITTIQPVLNLLQNSDKDERWQKVHTKFPWNIFTAKVCFSWEGIDKFFHHKM